MITEVDFIDRFGRPADGDELERVNCDKAGRVGHRMCGVCPDHDWPRFMCGCIAPPRADDTLLAFRVLRATRARRTR